MGAGTQPAPGRPKAAERHPACRPDVLRQPLVNAQALTRCGLSPLGGQERSDVGADISAAGLFEQLGHLGLPRVGAAQLDQGLQFGAGAGLVAGLQVQLGQVQAELR